jgi:hypothetical protein
MSAPASIPQFTVSRVRQVDCKFGTNRVSVVATSKAKVSAHEEPTPAFKTSVRFEVHAAFLVRGNELFRRADFVLERNDCQRAGEAMSHFEHFLARRADARLGDEVSMELFSHVILATRSDSMVEKYLILRVESEGAEATLISDDLQVFSELRKAIGQAFFNL